MDICEVYFFLLFKYFNWSWSFVILSIDKRKWMPPIISYSSLLFCYINWLYFQFSVCCVICSCVCAHMGGRAFACVHTCVQRSMLSFFLNYTSPYFMRQSLSLNPDLTPLGQTDSQYNPETLWSPSLKCSVSKDTGTQVLFLPSSSISTKFSLFLM